MLIAGIATFPRVSERVTDPIRRAAEPPRPPPMDEGGSRGIVLDHELRDSWLYRSGQLPGDAYRQPPLVAEPPPMTARRALTIVDAQFDTVESARDGKTDGVASVDDLRAVVDPDARFDPLLVDASRYLLDHPEVFSLMEVMNDGDRVSVSHGRVLQSDDRFAREDIAVFLGAQTHLAILWDHRDVIDTAGSGGVPDGELSRGDLERVRDATDENGDGLYDDGLRDAARFVLDHDRVFDVLDGAAPLRASLDTGASAGGTNFTDGRVSTTDLQTAILQLQVFADDPARARRFILDGGAFVEGRNVSDENSVSDAGLRALYASAVRDADTNAEIIELVSRLPETNGGFRNELITASYAELAVGFDEFLGPESGANWSHWAVPASTAVGDVIRNEPVIEIGVTNNGATGSQRTAMAEGNLLLFDELAPHLQSFLDTFGDDAAFDADKLDAYLERFDEEQRALADGLESYYRARFTEDPKARQEAVLLGNYYIVTHEQALVDDVLDKVLTDLPWYADGFNLVSGNLGSDRANAAIAVSYPGREPTSVEHDVPIHDPTMAAYGNRVVRFADIEDDRLRVFLETSAAANDGAPDSRVNTYADDWHEFHERMFYIYQDWRLHHTDQGLFDLAADGGYASVDLGNAS